MNQNKQLSDDEEFAELANDEDENSDDEEFDEEDLSTLPSTPRTLNAVQAKQMRDRMREQRKEHGISQKTQESQQEQGEIAPVTLNEDRKGRGRPRLSPEVVQSRNQGNVPVVPQVRIQETQAKKYTTMYQAERVGVGYADTNEVIAEGMPLWAAQMWADLKNEMADLKTAIGSM